MRRVMIAAAASVMLLASCGVDKDGTGDNLVENLEKQGYTFTDDEKDCVKDVVKAMSDDDIKAISDGKASEELQADFGTNVAACLPGS